MSKPKSKDVLREAFFLAIKDEAEKPIATDADAREIINRIKILLRCHALLTSDVPLRGVV